MIDFTFSMSSPRAAKVCGDKNRTTAVVEQCHGSLSPLVEGSVIENNRKTAFVEIAGDTLGTFTIVHKHNAAFMTLPLERWGKQYTKRVKLVIYV